MKKKFRILKSDEFTQIIQHRHYYHGGSLVLYVKKRTNSTSSRVGISVTKKLGNAVKRNKAKRQIRDICNKLYNFNEKFDTIIIVRASYDIKKYEDNLKLLISLYNKVKI
ncbi:MAG: ribonuclease P protein component [Erysipelotrichaceae bacterium]